MLSKYKEIHENPSVGKILKNSKTSNEKSLKNICSYQDPASQHWKFCKLKALNFGSTGRSWHVANSQKSGLAMQLSFCFNVHTILGIAKLKPPHRTEAWDNKSSQKKKKTTFKYVATSKWLVSNMLKSRISSAAVPLPLNDTYSLSFT